MAKYTDKQLNEIFGSTHKAGETCRITISLFTKHYALKPFVDKIAQHVSKFLLKIGLRHLKDFMISISPIISEEDLDIPKGLEPIDVRNLEI